MLADFVRHTDIDVVMLAGRYRCSSRGRSTICCHCARAAASEWWWRAYSTAGCWRATNRPTTRSTTTRARRPTFRPRSTDRKRLRTPRRLASGDRDRLSPRTSRCRQRLSRRTLAGADRAKCRPVPQPDPAGRLGRAQVQRATTSRRSYSRLMAVRRSALGSQSRPGRCVRPCARAETR